jgi:RNA polymerase sigma-70 factor (ECF subfamily)
VAEQARTEALSASVVAALRTGDARAFGVVYEAYRARLYSFLLRLTGDEQSARDLSQETWLRLAANARGLGEDSDPGAWLFTVARNLFTSQRRWLLRDRLRLAQLGLLARSATAATPLEQAAVNELERRLERALLALPVRYREVVLLVCTEGFATDEVGSMLGLEPAAVRKRLSRGRALLRAALERGGAKGAGDGA